MHFRTSFGRFAPTIPLVPPMIAVAHPLSIAPPFFLTSSAPLCDVNAKPIRSRPQIELQAIARRGRP